MIPHLVLFACLFVAGGLIRKDMAERDGVSAAIWIPTLWIGILMSRPLSMWLNWGGGDDSLEGSPLDRLFYFGIILAALLVLIRRRVAWGRVVSENWAIFLFYAYFLVSVLWAPESFVAFKRWFKDFGNIFVALVILTEAKPEHAIRAVMVRCAYVLMPLSIVFVRFFPDLGRSYTRAGNMEVTGVTMQKNSLGILVVICGLALLWDWFERTSDTHAVSRTRLQRSMPFVFVLIGAYLLYLCNSVTSILCLVLGGGILTSARLPGLRNRIGSIGFLVLGGVLAFFLADWLFNIKGELLAMLGRDASLTGRTAVWDWLLSLKIDPLLGDGFCSFWSDDRYLSLIPPHSGIGASAHNGYLEVYIDGGYVGLFFLAVMLLSVASRINRHLTYGDNFALFRFAIYVAMLVGDISESHWGRMSPLGFMFLLTAIGFVESAVRQRTLAAAPDRPEARPCGAPSWN